MRRKYTIVERIKRRATQLIPELRNICYESRLSECGLTKLETRILRGDQLELLKLLKGYENVNSNMFFKT